jgi:hypothetical protein
LKAALDTVFIPNLEISICVRIPGSKHVTQSLLPPAMIFVTCLNSTEGTWPWLEDHLQSRCCAKRSNVYGVGTYLELEQRTQQLSWG